MIRRIAILSIASAYLAGCTTMAPSYDRPDMPVPVTWPTGAAYKNSVAQAGDPVASALKWNEFFVNPQLQKLIALALL